MDTTEVFAKNIEAYNKGESIIINQGGTRSSKTWSILQLLFLIASKSESKLVISVVSRALPHLKLGAMRDFDMILIDAGMIPDQIKNKTENYYKVGKSIIEFFGADQLDKVHGPARDILFLNEANFIKFDVYTSLFIRTTRCVFIDYNPSVRFWVHDEIMPNEKHTFIKSTYINNTSLPDNIRQKLDVKRETYERMVRGEIKFSKSLENWWRVYGLGDIGILEGAIFDNWRYARHDEFEQAVNQFPSGFGLDYGFHPDPDAMAHVAIDRRRKIIYVKECIYKTNNGTEDLRYQMSKFIRGNELVIAESANPRTNHDLKRNFNIKKVRKTKTVADWLRIMQDYEIVITEDSYNMEKELQNYVWSDKRAGVPVDEYNHLCDAVRYFVMNILQPKPQMRAE